MKIELEKMKNGVKLANSSCQSWVNGESQLGMIDPQIFPDSFVRFSVSKPGLAGLRVRSEKCTTMSQNGIDRKRCVVR